MVWGNSRGRHSNGWAVVAALAVVVAAAVAVVVTVVVIVVVLLLALLLSPWLKGMHDGGGGGGDAGSRDARREPLAALDDGERGDAKASDESYDDGTGAADKDTAEGATVVDGGR